MDATLVGGSPPRRSARPYSWSSDRAVWSRPCASATASWTTPASPFCHVSFYEADAYAGAVGECNGKLMSDLQVLRGASCATPAGHERLTCRNFCPAAARWAFADMRLARP